MDTGSLLRVHPITDFQESSLDRKKYPGDLVDASLDPGSALTRRPG